MIGRNMQRIETAYKAFLDEGFPLPTEKQVSDLEERLGLALPSDYRQFVLDFNGGFFNDPRIVSASDGRCLDGLTVMDGIGATDPSAELASDDKLVLFEDNDPIELLPVGYTLKGGLLLLVTHPEGFGSMILKEAFSDKSHMLADGIEGFFALLH
jgi:hypothetical protein